MKLQKIGLTVSIVLLLNAFVNVSAKSFTVAPGSDSAAIQKIIDEASDAKEQPATVLFSEGEYVINEVLRPQIIRPRISAPYIRTSGETIDIYVCDLDITKFFSLFLQNDRAQIKLKISDTKPEKIIYDCVTGASYNWVISASVPPGINEGLYDVLVSSNNGYLIQRKAIKLVELYKQDFTFIHLSDTHIGAQDYVKRNKHLRDLFKKLQDFDPEFIAITGDCIHNMAPTAKEGSADILWEDFLNYFRDIHIPIYVCPGNHDFRDEADMLSEYNRCMGPRYFSFDYGRNHFIMLDNAWDCSGYEKQVKWADEDLTRHHNSQFKVILQHVFFDDGHMPSYFRTLCDKHGINLLLDGHMHRNKESSFGKTPTLHLNIAAVNSNGYDPEQHGKGWFCVINVKDGKIRLHKNLQIQ